MVQGLIGQNPEGRRLLVRLLIAFAPAAILGPLLDDTIEATLFQPVPVLAALGIGGVIMLKLGKGRADPSDTDPADLPLRAAPDRLGPVHCHVAGHQPFHGDFGRRVALGLRPARAAEFSFLLGLPTLGGACVYKLLKDGDTVLALGTPSWWSVFWWRPSVRPLPCGWLVGFLTNRGLAPFGWYRLALTVVVAAAWASGWIELDASSGDASSTP